MVKKATYILTAMLMMFALTLVKGVPLAHATDHMSKEEAGKIVTDQYGGEVKNVEEESDGAIYEVEVEGSDDGRIEVDVDAAKGNGDILKIEYKDSNKEDKTYMISKEKAEEVATDQYGGHVKETEIEHEEDNDGNYVLVYEVELRGTGEDETEVDVIAYGPDKGEIFDSDKGARISKEKALDIVQDEYGGKPDGDLDDAVEEEDDGDTWEVEVVDSSEGNIEVDVDAYSGEIDKDSIEHDNISKEKAGEIAKDKYGGDIKAIEKGHEDGVLVYQVELRNSDEGHMKVNVAAGSGDIMNKDKNEPVTIDRLKGKDRYDTAISISKDNWKDGALKGKSVVVARGDNFSDALAGVPLAHAKNSPILLEPTDTSTKNKKEWKKKTDEEINRLGADKVFILGGDEAVSHDIENQLNEDKSVTRLADNQRFGTAVEIAKYLKKDGDVSGNKVAVANGMKFADAMSVASSAAENKMPILLTKKDAVPDKTKNAFDSLGVKNSYAIGEKKVINKDVYGQLPSPTRLGGADRFETNQAVMNQFDVNADHMYVATGNEYPDALTGAVLAADKKSGVVFVNNTLNDIETAGDEMKDANNATIFGGPKAVSKDIQHQLEDALN